jgi:hypothetical protein
MPGLTKGCCASDDDDDDDDDLEGDSNQRVPFPQMTNSMEHCHTKKTDSCSAVSIPFMNCL